MGDATDRGELERVRAHAWLRGQTKRGERRGAGRCVHLSLCLFLIYLLFHFFSRILFPIFVSFHLAQLCLNLVFCSVLFLLASSFLTTFTISFYPYFPFFVVNIFIAFLAHTACISCVLRFFSCLQAFVFTSHVLQVLIFAQYYCVVFFIRPYVFFFTSSLQLRYSLLI